MDKTDFKSAKTKICVNRYYQLARTLQIGRLVWSKDILTFNNKYDQLAEAADGKTFWRIKGLIKQHYLVSFLGLDYRI